MENYLLVFSSPGRRKNISRTINAFLSVGLVTAVEELFGLALSTPESFGEMEEVLGSGARLCEPWRRLNGILEKLVQQRSSYVKADVIDSCDDALLCELISRASARAVWDGGNAEVCQAVRARLTSELDLLRMEDLRGRLSQRSHDQEDQERTFESLRDAARRQHGLLGAAQRWSAPR